MIEWGRLRLLKGGDSMTSSSRSVTRNLELQGFACPGALATERALRFTPGASAALLGTATAFGSPALFGTFTVIGLLGSAGAHPFDLAYNHVVRRLAGGPRLPPNPRPRRFAMGLGATFSLITGALLAARRTVAGTAAGALLTSAALVTFATHFCLGSWILRRLESSLHRPQPG
jgi:hypothetical protein